MKKLENYLKLNDNQKSQLESVGHTVLISSGRRVCETHISDSLIELAYCVRHSDGPLSLEQMIEKYKGRFNHNLYIGGTGSITKRNKKTWIELEYESDVNHFVRFQISKEKMEEAGWKVITKEKRGCEIIVDFF